MGMESLDLVTLLAHAPRGIRLTVSVLLALWTYATTLTLALRVVPEDTFTRMEKAVPWLGHFFRAWRKFGTDVLPFFKELILAFFKLGGGGKGPPPMTVGLAVAALFFCCSAGPVQAQASVAAQLAQSWNLVGRSALVGAYEHDQRVAVDRVCPPGARGCSGAALRLAVEVVRQRWGEVWASEEAVRVAHDVWRTQLDQCRTRGGTCAPQLQSLAALFATRVVSWRCAVRAVGHPELDAFPGAPTCPMGSSDGH